MYNTEQIILTTLRGAELLKFQIELLQGTIHVCIRLYVCITSLALIELDCRQKSAHKIRGVV